jgi:acyl-CoA synthetase (NDP forming)
LATAKIMAHRLDPLIRPDSIAVLGATERAGSVGRQTVENLLQGSYSGRLFAVNPSYETVCGVPCYPALNALPEQAELVIFAVSDARVEAALDDVIAQGARAAIIMSSLVLAEDTEPQLRERVAKKIESAGLLVCGANGMGIYNFRDGVWAFGFDTREHRNDGTVTLISHSGSGLSGILDVDERIDFNLAVSTGQELCVRMDEYLDYALDQPETRVVGLFMETVRNPEGMRAALEKANRRGVPVVALKVGRTELSGRLAVSHSGAMAGRDAAFEALFDRYGVQRVDDMDELATALIMFAQPHSVANGGLVAIHDSGGERQLIIDMAERIGVPLTDISETTVARLKSLLDPGLPPVNPLDAWSAGGPNADQVMEECFATLLSDSEAALGAVVHDRAPEGRIYEEYIEYLRKGHAATGKPVFLVSNRQGTGADTLAVSVTRQGFPILDGLASFLKGVRCVLGYRDFCARPVIDLPALLAGIPEKWRSRLATGNTLDEAESTALLSDFGLPMNTVLVVQDETAARAAAQDCGYPVVLKTAKPDISHKTEHSGVKLGIESEQALTMAYREMSARLGARALVAPMIMEAGVEMMLGLIRDEQFGLLVTLGFGGVTVEILKDVAYVLPPFGASTARRVIDSLRLRPLLDGQRGRDPVDLAAFCAAAARLSVMASSLADVIEEVDLNPVIVNSNGCTAVDALVIGHANHDATNDTRKAI